MSVNLSIKNASDEVVAALKLRAQQNHRSLQGELMAIIEAAAADWSSKPETQELRETAAGWHAQKRAATAPQARERSDADADADMRERDIQHLLGLLEKGLPLGNRRFTRDEMHER